MKLYLVASRQQKLVSVDFNRFFQDPIQKEAVTKRDLESLYDDSTRKPFIACTSLKDAEQVMKCLKEDPANWHNDIASNASNKIKIFGTPVVFTIEVSDSILNEPVSILCGADLAEFPEGLKSSNPTYPYSPGMLDPKVTAKNLDKQIAQFPETIKIRKLTIPQSYAPEHAFYFNVDGTSLVDCDLNAPKSTSSSCTIV